MWHIYDGGRDARKHPFLWQKSTLCLKKHNKEKFRWNVLRLLGLAVPDIMPLPRFGRMAASSYRCLQ